MAEPAEPPIGLGDIDKLIHEPARMGILTVLSRVRSAEFLFLQSSLGLSGGNLSSHLSRLEAAGLVELTKSFRSRKPVTTATITTAGRQAIERHWQQLDSMRRLG